MSFLLGFSLSYRFFFFILRRPFNIYFRVGLLLLNSFSFWLSGKNKIHLEEMGFRGGSVIKNLLTMQETQVQSLGRKDPLEKEMATHSSIFAWQIPWVEEQEAGELAGERSVRNEVLFLSFPMDLTF